MLEIKVNVAVNPEFTSAVNNLAMSISGKTYQAQSQVSMTVPANPVSMSTSTAPAYVQAPAPAQPQLTPVQLQQPVAPITPVIPAQPQQSAAPIAGVPLAGAPQFTVDQIMAAGATLMDAGKVEDLMNLLHSFGVQAVMDLKPEQLGAFATEMRKLGAAI